MADRAKIALSIATIQNDSATELPMYRGFLIAMEEAAQRRDLPAPIEWVMFDDHSNADQAALLAETIVADRQFVGVVGHIGSTEALANAPIFNGASLLQVSPCASHPALCEQGYETFYRLVPNERVQGGALARLAYNQLEARSVAVVHANNPFGAAVADNFSDGFESLGGEIATRQGFDEDQADLGELASTVASASPDLVVFGVHIRDGLAASSAIRDAGVAAPFLGTDGMKPSFFLGGGEPGREVYHTHSGADFRMMETAKDFRESYVKRWPEDSTYSPESYDSVMLIVEALVRAGEVSREKVLEEFRALNGYQGITGIIRFDDSGERLDAPVSWYHVIKRDGERYMEYQGIVP